MRDFYALSAHWTYYQLILFNVFQNAVKYNKKGG
jgi:hypothetical protein